MRLRQVRAQTVPVLVDEAVEELRAGIEVLAGGLARARDTDRIDDGPIPVETAQLLGICFDRYEIATGRVVKFEAGDAEYNATRP